MKSHMWADKIRERWGVGRSDGKRGQCTGSPLGQVKAGGAERTACLLACVVHLKVSALTYFFLTTLQAFCRFSNTEKYTTATTKKKLLLSPVWWWFLWKFKLKFAFKIWFFLLIVETTSQLVKLKYFTLITLIHLSGYFTFVGDSFNVKWFWVTGELRQYGQRWKKWVLWCHYIGNSTVKIYASDMLSSGVILQFFELEKNIIWWCIKFRGDLIVALKYPNIFNVKIQKYVFVTYITFHFFLQLIFYWPLFICR